MITSKIIGELSLRRIRRLLNQPTYVLQALFVNEGRNPASMRSWVQAAGCPMECEIIAHSAYRDSESLRHFS